ncbi:SDR family oxidoreductase [Vibrio tritonius]|uniref:SDR family oxidoreductase n=1 Tax=Vibrio tritonius TaxID=1435069 RepID=A0ABS7YNC8_9VIBR|nr:SDR family oxidoreductase [Vibrio tritonius]MCA2016371.1 SDR family oxidoreductase [Vibrio tritonius]
MIGVTGATGQLGHLVIEHLLKTTAANQIVALVRNPQKASALKELGVEVREADYAKPDTLSSAFSGLDKLLLVSSSEVGQRATQHQNVIDAAKAAGVQLLAYTSILHADTSPLALAKEHVATETYLREADVPYVVLRNGWYTENYLASVAPALENQAFIGAAGNGKISSATRNDFAQAAAVVLTSSEPQVGKVYELSGDESYTLADLCAILSEESGNTIPYVNMPEEDYAKALESAGIPAPFAAILADSDAGASQGALFDDSHVLSKLIGRPTTALRPLVKAAL